MNKIRLVGFLAIAAMLPGCNDKTENKTITKYSTDKCFVDSIDGKADAIVYVKPGKVLITGWAFDDSKNTAVKDLEIHLTGAQGVPVIVGDPARISRMDVATAYTIPDLIDSGFDFTVDTTRLPPGAYGVTLAMPKGKAMFVCQSKKFVVVM